ncbi:ferritin-like domain-containing protein [Nostoc sp. LEGE 12450]|uniref:ferritin-like domain-containing protein n=1 Tax=Nostoc sp. LEGE 12450 TaxID=1828643 RepID=UPI001881D60E|nr:ferritin-like protein [Nostoc sp. LEGE 12450]MBE8989331.1 ferritin-like protein [Nostoc sp. LEGE 12450]
MSTDNQVKTREDLLYLLSQAAELEHSLACQYLCSAFSLKEFTNEAVSQAQLNKINRWRRTINEIAVEEMLHLALASNLLTAIGGAPYFRRANFPQAKTYTSLKLSFKLAPFNENTLNRYICFELPNNFDTEEQKASWNQFCQRIKDEELLRLLAALPQPLVPRKLEYNTIGELYGLIRQGFQTIGQKLFIGSPKAQATGIFKKMIQVKDLDSAIKAIDLIIMQGEGSPAQRDDSHFAKFTKIREEYLAELQNDPNFQPARPVIENPLLSLQQDNTTPGANIITDTLSRDVVEIFVALYEVMLQILLRFFAHTEENEEQMYVLKSAFINLMPFGVSPLAKAITQLPAGDKFPGMNAGPSFEVYADVQLLPQMSSAWIFFQERLQEIAQACDALINDSRTQSYPQVQQALTEVSATLKNIAHTISLEPNGGTWTNGISQLFSPMDVAHMRRQPFFPVNLGDYEDVKSNADAILDTVSFNRMPKLPEGPWTEARINLFKQWKDSNFPYL